MSSIDQTLHALPDVFCELYDRIDADEFAARAKKWLEDTGLDSVSASVASGVVAGSESRASIELRLQNCSDLGAQTFAILRGLDRAFAYVNPQLAGPAPPGLAALAAAVELHQRLDSQDASHGGALLARLISPARPEEDPVEPCDAFRSVVRVPESTWSQCDFRTLGETSLLHRHEILRGITVGCVPFIADPDELDFATTERAGRRYHRIGPREAEATMQRVEQVVSRLDEAGVMIAVVPELMLTRALLECWQRALTAPGRSASRLRWVLVGSGDLGASEQTRNTAVLLDGRTGQPICEQDKQYLFSLDVEELTRWGLESRLGDQPIQEDLVPRGRLQIVQAASMRVAILVCEDLTRAIQIGPSLRDFGVSHLLVPVFARPTQARRWERIGADIYRQAIGSSTIVSNSLVMHSILGAGEGTSLVVTAQSGQALIGTSSSADEPSCFRLLADGTVEHH